eukprot:RCo002976
MATSEAPQFPEQLLYSRQVFAVGADAQQKISQAAVLVVGLTGLGSEVCKNLILSGVRALIAVDSGVVEETDLCTNFFFRAEDVGKPRCHCCLPRLAELNPAVSCRVHSGPVDRDLLRDVDVACFVDQGQLEGLIECNEACRESGVGFIAAETRGVCGYVFVDLGSTFTTSDPDGVPVARHAIAKIAQQASLGQEVVEISVDEELRQPLGLVSGDLVRVDGVEGISGLNGLEHLVEKVTGSHSFTVRFAGTIPEPRAGARNGHLAQVKRPLTLSFRSLREALVGPPEAVPTDLTDPDHALHLHAAWRALNRWVTENQRDPRPGDSADSAGIL